MTEPTTTPRAHCNLAPGKTVCESFDDAVHLALTRSRRFGTSYRIYECGDHYHLTTKPQRGIPAVRGDR